MKKLRMMSLLFFAAIMLTACHDGLYYTVGTGYRSSYRPHVGYYDYGYGHHNYGYVIGIGAPHRDRGHDRHRGGGGRRGDHDRGHDGGRGGGRGGGHR